MTNITPEEVAKMARDHRTVAERHKEFVMGHPHHAKTADMLETLAAKLDSTLKDRALILAERDRTFALMLARAEAAEARVAELEALTNPINIEPATVAERDMLRLCTQAAEAENARLQCALTGIRRAAKARMESYGDEHSYYYFTAIAALTTKEQSK
jgi:Tfp pilus assembly protein PilN